MLVSSRRFEIVCWKNKVFISARVAAYFFALNTALRSKALRSRSYFVKRQTGMNANVPHTNEELLRMGKAQFTKIVTAFEHSLPCSAQEKIHQRSDLEAMVEQIEQDTFEFQVQELEETAQTAAQACGAGDQPHTAAAGELRQSLLDCQRFLDTMKVPGQASAAPDASPLLVSEGVGRQLSAGREDTGLAASGGPARDLGESPLLASEGVDRKQTAVRADTGLAASGGPAHDVRELAERLQVLLQRCRQVPRRLLCACPARLPVRGRPKRQAANQVTQRGRPRWQAPRRQPRLAARAPARTLRRVSLRPCAVAGGCASCTAFAATADTWTSTRSPATAALPRPPPDAWDPPRRRKRGGGDASTSAPWLQRPDAARPTARTAFPSRCTACGGATSAVRVRPGSLGSKT